MMKRLIPHSVLWAALLPAALLLLPGVARAQASHTASLERADVPDTTPQQRYRSAIREAGGGLKVSLEECRSMATADRRSCEAQARSRYQADMANARAIRRGDPSAGPVNVVGAPIRSTETTYVIKP